MKETVDVADDVEGSFLEKSRAAAPIQSMSVVMEKSFTSNATFF